MLLFLFLFLFPDFAFAHICPVPGKLLFDIIATMRCIDQTELQSHKFCLHDLRLTIKTIHRKACWFCWCYKTFQLIVSCLYNPKPSSLLRTRNVLKRPFLSNCKYKHSRWHPEIYLSHHRPLPWSEWPKDHSVNALSQWETTLHCNLDSHCLGAYTKWPLWSRYTWGRNSTRYWGLIQYKGVVLPV